MSQSLFIPGPLPGTNDLHALAGKRKGKWDPYNIVKQKWQRDIHVLIKKAKLVPIGRPALFTFYWVELNHRRDFDNVTGATKIILDAFVESKILPTDGWRWIKGISHRLSVDKKNPGVQVEIRELPYP